MLITALLVLAVLVALSLAFNVYYWHRWSTYRSKSAGSHSHTGFMRAITPDDIKKDKKGGRK